MRTLLVSLLLVMPAVVYAQPPSITAVSGSLTGPTLTISGVNFGSKPSGPPWKFDSMDGANGDRLESRGWLVHQNTPQPALSSVRPRPNTGATTSARLTQTMGNVPWFGFGNNDGGYMSFTAESAANYRPFPTPAWIDYWMYFHPPAGSNNYKFFRHHANNSSSIPNSFWGMSGPGGVTTCDNFTWSSFNGPGILGESAGHPSLGCPVLRDKWVHVQMAFRTGVTDGQFWMWIDGVEYFSSPNGWQFESVGTQRANFGLESQQLTSTGDGEMYIDDFYIDNSYARVELCSGTPWSARGHCETQIPIAWANDAIQVQLNRGSFPSLAGLYLYVVNAQGAIGTPSASFALGGTTPPQPPASVNCVTSPWSAWTATTAPGACVNGQQQVTEERSRTVLTPPENGGLACGPLSESRTVTQPCALPPPPTPIAGCTFGGRTTAPGKSLPMERLPHTSGNTTQQAAIVARMEALTAAGFSVQWTKDGGYSFLVPTCEETR
jgi:hypothetical protein